MTVLHPHEVTCADLPGLLGGSEVVLWREGRRLHTSRGCAPNSYQVAVRLDRLGRFQPCTKCKTNASDELHTPVARVTGELAENALEEAENRGERGTAFEAWKALRDSAAHLRNHGEPGPSRRMQEWEERWAQLPPLQHTGEGLSVHFVHDDETEGPAVAVVAEGTRAAKGNRRVVVVPADLEEVLEDGAANVLAGGLEEGDSVEVLETALTLWIDNEERGVWDLTAEIAARDALAQARLVHHA